jgi:hypothetical protein
MVELRQTGIGLMNTLADRSVDPMANKAEVNGMEGEVVSTLIYMVDVGNQWACP